MNNFFLINYKKKNKIYNYFSSIDILSKLIENLKLVLDKNMPKFFLNLF